MKYQVVLEVFTDDRVDITKRATKKKIEEEILNKYTSGNLFKRVNGINRINLAVKAAGVV